MSNTQVDACAHVRDDAYTCTYHMFMLCACLHMLHFFSFMKEELKMAMNVISELWDFFTDRASVRAGRHTPTRMPAHIFTRRKHHA